ncbi:hypothetical protein [Christiangramia gaetbulicola]|nr:hypothetical protein [Christiangramia gaetbulicola]
MKKKLHFDPPKPTKLHEYITIEYGKIRNVHYLQMIQDLPPGIHDALKKSNSKITIPVNDEYTVLKNFHLPPKLEKVDPYIKKQKNAKYTHELILPNWESVDKYFKNFSTTKIYPPSDYILKTMVRDRKVFIKLTPLEKLKIDYYLFDFSTLTADQKISIIGITIGTIITIVLSVIGWTYFTN